MRVVVGWSGYRWRLCEADCRRRGMYVGCWDRPSELQWMTLQPTVPNASGGTGVGTLYVPGRNLRFDCLWCG